MKKKIRPVMSSKKSWMTVARKMGYSIKELLKMYSDETGNDPSNNTKEFVSWCEDLLGISNKKVTSSTVNKSHSIMASDDDTYLSDLVEGVRSLVNDPKFTDYMQQLENIYEILRWNLNDADQDEVLYKLTHPAYNSGDNFVRFYHLCESITRLLRGYN